MHKDVKLCSDNRDIKGLRYIFVDSLDVDPTFEKYMEDFEYCRNLSGLFDEHKELSPLVLDESQWDSTYWANLKTDLLKNFSLKRFQHMQRVAKVVYAEKIKRLSAERQKSVQPIPKTSGADVMVKNTLTGQKPVSDIRKNTQTLEETVARQNEERIREMAIANQKYEEEKRKEEEKKRQHQEEIRRQKERDSNIKKVVGIALAVIIILIIIIVLM